MADDPGAQLTQTARRLLQKAAAGSLAPQDRGKAASAVGDAYSSGKLSPRERQIAADILGILARDLEIEVRAALAEHVKSCPFLPRKIAVQLAHDIESVALPIIRFSEALADDDLIKIVRSDYIAKQLAAARRDNISPPLANSLIGTKQQSVVGTLLENRRTELDEPTLHKILNEYESVETIKKLMIDRRALPITITIRLVQSISKELENRLINEHGLPQELADELSMQGREKSMTTLVAPERRQIELKETIAYLAVRKLLTPTLILRAICVGDILFFELCMSQISNLPRENVQKMAYGRPQDFEKLYGRTDLPLELYRAFCIALDVKKKAALSGRTSFMAYTNEVIQRLLNEYDEVCPEDLEHFLSQISRRVIGPRKRSRTASGLIP